MRGFWKKKSLYVINFSVSSSLVLIYRDDDIIVVFAQNFIFLKRLNSTWVCAIITVMSIDGIADRIKLHNFLINQFLNWFKKHVC